ncbi:MAG: DNA-methyltransferase [Micavibrio sp.]
MSGTRKEIIGDCTLYLGQCEDILPSIGRVDILCMDPPYEFRAVGGGAFRKDRQCMDDIIENGLDQGFDIQIINGLLYRSVVVFCHNDQLHKILPHIAGNYHRHAVCFWEKQNPMPVANKHYMPDLEPYIHAWNQDGHPLGDLVDKRRVIRTPNGASEFDHPTVKPLAVMEKIMRNANGDSVLDPFMGTGSTGVAAVKCGKKFIGIERQEKYFDIACKRIEGACKLMEGMDG